MSFILLGILNAQAQPAGAAGAYDLLETQITTGSESAINFTNLVSSYASDYQHLQLRVANSQLSYIRLNSDSGSNYSYHRLVGIPGGSPQVENGGSNSTSISMDYAGIGGVLGVGVMDILDPFNSSKYTTTKFLAGRVGGSRIALESGNWRSTNQVDSINLTLIATSTGDRFSLYGLKAA